ncbi:hypothetical protein [Rhodococcus sp. 06-418-5]|uniref:hypothetical protein n=1 Tax=Rhodococcus sp. 06-418-5 TaxID=2022507 RepID=UPI00117B5379|nr:hypothetical protein [Rhodococcus sp. 06-418-5]
MTRGIIHSDPSIVISGTDHIALFHSLISCMTLAVITLVAALSIWALTAPLWLLRRPGARIVATSFTVAVLTGATATARTALDAPGYWASMAYLTPLFTVGMVGVIGLRKGVPFGPASRKRKADTLIQDPIAGKAL